MSDGSKVRSRVRTQWLALGAALVVLAGVVVAWALAEAADRVPVVQVAQPVRAGEVIQADHLRVTDVAVGTDVAGLVPDTSLDRLVGRVAAIDLVPGVLVVDGMWRDAPDLLAGEQRIGAVMASGAFPAGLGQGDSALAAPLDPLDTRPAVTVRVLDVRGTADGGTEFTLAVPAADAVALAQLAANDQLVLVGLKAAEPPASAETDE
mgnify:CR=1 FL=1